MTIAALNLESVAQLSAERILNCAAEGMIIVLLAWLLLRALGRQNSGTRFAVWFAALLGIAALPLFGNWAAGGAALTKGSEITLPGTWALYISAAWLLMASAGLIRVGIGFWHLHRLRKSCVPVDVAALSPILRKTLAEFDSSRVVKLCTSDQLRVPTAIGFMEPLVVIPTWTMRELSEPELNPILLHELAHLRRRDDWTNLAQKILSALLFFHPAVWWIEKKLTLEREMACDDLVLAETTSPRAYAECLVAMAERSCLRRGSALAQAAVDRLRHVALRVSQILDVDRPHATRVWRPAPVLVTGVSLVCLVALSHAPTRLVSFENTATPSSLASEIPSGDFARNAMAAMGAHVVPAELHMQRKEVRRERVPLAGKSSVSIVAKSAVKSPFRTMRKPEVFPASAAEHRVKAPLLVRSSMRDQAVAPRTLFLVMQTEVVQGGQYVVQGGQYDDAPVVVWGLCVWQVTVTGPGQNQVVAGIIAKSI